MKTKLAEVPINDLLGLYAFVVLHNPTFATLKEESGLAYGVCTADEEFYKLAQRFNQNEPVPVQDFLRVQLEIRSQMLALKNGGRQAKHG